MTTAGEKVQLRRDAMVAQYRDLQLPADVLGGIAESGIVLAGHLHLTLGDRVAIRTRARQLMKLRSRRQPGWQPSAGCFFKNPSMDRPAGRLIDEAGLKGLQVGDAQVSDRHANFIINLGRATAEQVLALSAKVQERVQNYTGVLLTPEVRIVGEEKANPQKPL